MHVYEVQEMTNGRWVVVNTSTNLKVAMSCEDRADADNECAMLNATEDAWF